MRTLIILLLLMVGGTGYVQAQMPSSVNVQGQLFQKDGQPVPDGSYDVTITLYESATEDVNPITVCGPCTVAFTMGVFNVDIGGPGQTPLPRFNKQYWIAFKIGNEELRPRLKLSSVPSALEAAYAPGVVPVATIVIWASKKGYDYYKAQSDYRVCEGQAMSSTEFPELYALIDTTWGNGSNDADPATDFNLPDLRGMFLRGDDGGMDRDAGALGRTPAGEVPHIGDLDGDGAPDRVGTYQGVGNSSTYQQVPNVAVRYLIRVR